MVTEEPGAGLRARLGVGGAMVLLVVVAVAAGTAGGPAAARHAGGVGGLGVPDWAGNIVVGALTAGGTLLVCGFLVALLRGARVRRRWYTKKLPWWYWPVAAAVAVAAAALSLGLLALLPHGKAGRGVAPSLGSRARLPALPQVPRAEGAHLSWEPFAVGAALTLAAVAAYWLFTRRRTRPAPTWKPLEERKALQHRQQEAVAVIDESLDALYAEPDPRRAVIAAYARMDSWLARAGFGRRTSEAPFEHLDRVMDGLGATAAVGATLALLFERAKFDWRPCGQDMKQSALGALVQLRDELAAAALLPAPPRP